MAELAAPILFDLEGGVARLRFNRPEVLNAISVPLANSFRALIDTLSGEPDLRVVVLSGEGRNFIAGGDLSAFLPPAVPPDVAREMIEGVHDGMKRLLDMPVPVIASVHGAVAGAGVSFTLFADYAIAADNTRFNMAYAKVAAPPDGGGSWSLPAILGLRKALEIYLLSETIDAAEALRLGLVNRVVPLAELAAETDKLARQLAQGPTRAFGAAKRLMRDAAHRSFADQLDAERDAWIANSRSEDFNEGVAAFTGKRPPQFTGR